MFLIAFPSKPFTHMKFILTLLINTFTSCLAQRKDYSKDVASVDAIIAVLYDLISGDPGVYRCAEGLGVRLPDKHVK